MKGQSGISWSQLRVGVAVAGALSLLAVATFFIGETGEVFGDRYMLMTLMPSANGLIEGASVHLAGQDVGKVDAIDFVPVDQRRRPDQVLRITLAINERVREHIRADSEARLRTQGLLGDKVVDLTPGTTEAPVLQPGDTIPSAAALDYEQMLGSAAQLVDDLSVMLRNMRAIADTLMAGEGTAGRLLMDSTLYVELVQTSRSMNEFLGAVGRGEGALAQLAQDEELYRDLRSVVSGLDSLTATLVRGNGTLARLLTDSTLYRELSSTSARADSMLAALASGQGTMGQLLTDQELYESLLRLLVDMQTIVEEIRQDPRRYIPQIKVF